MLQETKLQILLPEFTYNIANSHAQLFIIKGNFDIFKSISTKTLMELLLDAIYF